MWCYLLCATCRVYNYNVARRSGCSYISNRMVPARQHMVVWTVPCVPLTQTSRWPMRPVRSLINKLNAAERIYLRRNKCASATVCGNLIEMQEKSGDSNGAKFTSYGCRLYWCRMALMQLWADNRRVIMVCNYTCGIYFKSHYSPAKSFDMDSGHVVTWCEVRTLSWMPEIVESGHQVHVSLTTWDNKYIACKWTWCWQQVVDVGMQRRRNFLAIFPT